MDRFLNIDQTNPTQSALKANKPQPKRSLFNLSRVVEQNIEIGRIHVIDVIETMPNDVFRTMDYIISLQSRNPTIKSTLTGMRCYVHAHYMAWSDIWEGAQNFVTTGKSGKMTLEMPTLQTTIKHNDEDYTLATPGSLIDEIGAPATHYYKMIDRLKYGFGAKIAQENETGHVGKNAIYGDDTINALPFAMYQMIYLQRYANRNMLNSNNNWTPENQKHWILPYNAKKVAKLSYTEPEGYGDDLNDAWTKQTVAGVDYEFIDPNGKAIIPQDDETNVYIAMPRYRLKKGDYFTTGLPFSQLIRGDVPTLDLATVVSEIDWTEVVKPTTGFKGGAFVILEDDNLVATYDTDSNNVNIRTRNLNDRAFDTSANGQNVIEPQASYSSSQMLLNTLSKAKVNATVQANIDMSTLNALEALTLFRQRNALTNGRYNEMVDAQFGFNPKTPTNDPEYIGGFYFDITSQDVIQTSESNTTPLGSKVGRLDSGHANRLGQWHARDYGYIMVTMSIVPDTYYNAGLERQLTRKRQDEVYFPIFNNLAPQAILNKELYYTGDETKDNDIMAWTERYSDYKSRQNRTKGLLALEQLEDSAYTMQNWYDETPTLNNRWLSQSQENTDMGVFTTTTEPPFVATIGQHIEAVRPMPYITLPGGLGGGVR